MKLFLISILFTLFLQTNIVAQNYQPINEETNNLFLTKDGQYAYYNNRSGTYVRSQYDSIVVDFYTTIFFPYKTARYEDVSEWGCQYLRHHNWMGSKIEYDQPQSLTSFYYTPVQFDNAVKSYDYYGERTFPVFHNSTVGGKWYIDYFENIFAEVIAEEIIEWHGLPDTIKTIRVSDLDNRYEWDEEFIRISKNYGLVSFPNLQFYPYKWINCERKGMTNPSVGVHEPSAREMFHMNVGDEYTTEFNRSHWTNIKQSEYKKVRCIKINSDNGDLVNRDIEITTIIFNTNSQKWEKTVIDSTEEINYQNNLFIGKANEFVDPYLPPYETSLALFDSTERRSNIRLSSGYENCVSQPFDHCNNFYSFAHAFDTYYECSGGWDKYDYYIPRYIKYGDEIWGEDINFDSLLTSPKISWNEKVNFYPNPNSGIFSFDNISQREFKEFRAINILGKEISLIADVNSSKTDIKLNAPAGVYFIYGIDNQNRFIGLGRVVKVE